MKFKIILLSFLIFNWLNLDAQDRDDTKAKSYAQEAIRLYENNNFSESLNYLEKAEKELGETNALILNLEIKVLYEQKKYDEAYNRLLLFTEEYQHAASQNLRQETISYFPKIEKGIEKKEKEEKIKRENDRKMKLAREQEKRHLEKEKELKKEKELEIKDIEKLKQKIYQRRSALPPNVVSGMKKNKNFFTRWLIFNLENETFEIDQLKKTIWKSRYRKGTIKVSEILETRIFYEDVNLGSSTNPNIKRMYVLGLVKDNGIFHLKGTEYYLLILDGEVNYYPKHLYTFYSYDRSEVVKQKNDIDSIIRFMKKY